MLVELQGMFEHNKAGIRKNTGTKLINSKAGKVIYTPPQDGKEIRDLLKNIEDYINENDDEVAPLIKMALIHSRFESIHSFYDEKGKYSNATVWNALKSSSQDAGADLTSNTQRSINYNNTDLSLEICIRREWDYCFKYDMKSNLFYRK